MALAVAFDGRWAALGGWIDREAGELQIWSVSPPSRTSTLGKLASPVSSVAISPDGHTVAAGGLFDGTIRLWNLQGQREPVTLAAHQEGDQIFGLASSPDSQLLVAASGDLAAKEDTGTLRFFGPEGQTAGRSVRCHGRAAWCVAFSPDGTTFASRGEDGLVRFWNTGDRSPRGTHRVHGGRVRAVAYSPDGKLLASGGTDGKVNVWRVPDR